MGKHARSPCPFRRFAAASVRCRRWFRTIRYLLAKSVKRQFGKHFCQSIRTLRTTTTAPMSEPPASSSPPSSQESASADGTPKRSKFEYDCSRCNNRHAANNCLLAGFHVFKACYSTKCEICEEDFVTKDMNEEEPDIIVRFGDLGYCHRKCLYAYAACPPVRKGWGKTRS